MNGVTLPFGEERFAVRRVYCVGQNYSEHVREMGGDPTANVPCFFMKPTDGLLGPGARVPYPPETLDLTRRDLQADLKRRAHPWELAKSFTGSAVVSALVPWGPGLPPTTVLRLTVNGTVRQDATLGAMIRDVEDLLVLLSRYDALAPGDLLFTGTPAGVGPLGVGDRLEAVCGEARLEATVVDGA
jgi:fumarylpyruvate hydrolase